MKGFAEYLSRRFPILRIDFNSLLTKDQTQESFNDYISALLLDFWQVVEARMRVDEQVRTLFSVLDTDDIPDAIEREDRPKESHNMLRERINAMMWDFAKLQKVTARLEREQALAQHEVRAAQMSMELHMSQRELAELGSRMSNMEENAELLSVVPDRKG